MQKTSPCLRVHLGQFGYKKHILGEYSSLAFLTDNLLLVTVNQRTSEKNADPWITDLPLSTLVGFDVVKRQELWKTTMAVMKSPRSVAPLMTENFLVLSSSVAMLCSTSLSCEKSFPTRGTITELDADSIKLLKAENLAIRDEDVSNDGTISVSSELSTTSIYKIIHPLDGIDEPSPGNFLLIRVFDKQSGKTLLSLHLNPKNHYEAPALSPDGAKLAIVRSGVLEVYNRQRH